MTQEQFNQLVEGNKEVPVGQYIIVAKEIVSDKTKAGVIISDSMKEELTKRQDLLVVIAVNDTSILKPGNIIRAGRLLTQQTPLVSTVDGYELAMVMNHDIMTKQKGFSND
jgi:co-chaperonin GroES (HSP10)